jgi:hypothetical protein
MIFANHQGHGMHLAFEGVTSEFCKLAAAVQWVPIDFADSILCTPTRGVFSLLF